MRGKPIAALAAALLLSAWPAGTAGKPELKYVAIVSRHGVRSPTWDNSRLNEYSAEPWPDWGVPPGNLTPHGRELIQRMGEYYRQWLAEEHLLQAGCASAQRVYIWADKDQRTIETGRAFSESLLPDCGIAVHSQPGGTSDPLFSGVGTPDPEKSLAAVRERLGPNPQKLLADHRAALDALQAILGKKSEGAGTMEVASKGKSVDLSGPFATGSTFSEDFLLEYTNGMRGKALGWGRLTPENLFRVLELHAVYADLMRRTPYLARARASNLLSHIVRSMEQAASGKPAAGALGAPETAVLLLVGHDTNLSNLSGMLGLSWKLASYQPDDTPPGGALIFSLWQEGWQFRLKLRYVAQTMDQMRNGVKLSLSVPPAGQDVELPGCTGGCPWETARAVLEKAIDPTFVQ